MRCKPPQLECSNWFNVTFLIIALCNLKCLHNIYFGKRVLELYYRMSMNFLKCLLGSPFPLLFVGCLNFFLLLKQKGYEKNTRPHKRGKLLRRFSTCLSKLSFRNLNTQNRTNSTIVSPVKMEYRWNFSISGLKMLVKSGLEEIFLKFLHALAIFY